MFLGVRKKERMQAHRLQSLSSKCSRENIPHNNSKVPQQTDANVRAAIKNILKDLEGQFVQKYADILTFPFAKTR